MGILLAGAMPLWLLWLYFWVRIAIVATLVLIPIAIMFVV